MAALVACGSDCLRCVCGAVSAVRSAGGRSACVLAPRRCCGVVRRCDGHEQPHDRGAGSAFGAASRAAFGSAGFGWWENVAKRSVRARARRANRSAAAAVIGERTRARRRSVSVRVCAEKRLRCVVVRSATERNGAQRVAESASRAPSVATRQVAGGGRDLLIGRDCRSDRGRPAGRAPVWRDWRVRQFRGVGQGGGGN